MALRDALHQAIGEPRIVLQRQPGRRRRSQAAARRNRAAKKASKAASPSSADPAMATADCRIEWRGGGAERSEGAIEAALAELIARRFSNLPSVED